ncbi:MAG: dTDP-glucose 4,6-dehydratase [Alphaproteobacteria bacterium]|nr:dTDP-glucose 4,6-dehydratase [Alphaproteobacteria bacterium]
MTARHHLRNVLVTGGAGFIGANFVLHLRRQRPQVRIVNLDSLTYAADLANLDGLAGDGGYRFVRGDICDRDLVTALLVAENIDTVVHFAAESHVDRSIAAPADFVRSNVLGTQALLAACRSVWQGKHTPVSGVRFHHISTDEVFGSLAAEHPPFDETTPYAPNSPYSASKAAADHLVRAYAHTYGLPVLITHCSNNYGPRQHAEKFIPTVIRKALAGETVPVYGNGLNRRDWLFVDDHCAALLSALERGPHGETYCIGGGYETSNLELARRICDLLDEMRAAAKPHRRLIAFVPDRPGHDFRYAIDATKIRHALGWAPRVSADEGLRRTIAWYLARTPAGVGEPARGPGSDPVLAEPALGLAGA